jgi:ribosome silencing factor RsfS/YbeB/iojap
MNKKIDKIISLIDEKKGENIQVFDMKETGYFVDTVIIATTLGDRHGFALLDTLKSEIKKMDEQILGIEDSGEWIVLDLGDTLIHLMTPEYRAKYNLEEFLDNYVAIRNSVVEE